MNEHWESHLRNCPICGGEKTLEPYPGGDFILTRVLPIPDGIGGIAYKLAMPMSTRLWECKNCGFHAFFDREVQEKYRIKMMVGGKQPNE